MAANVRTMFLLAIVAALGGCKSSAPPLTETEKNLVGEYKQWTLLNEEYMDMESMHSSGANMTWRLSLKADRTFTLKIRSNVMINVTDDSSGTLKVEGSQLMLTGTSQYETDDGYKKSKGERAYSETLDITKEGLVPTKNREGKGYVLKTVYRKTTDPLPVPPKPKVVALDSKAAVIAKNVEDKYGSLQSYSDHGELTSDGKGFQPKAAKFLTYFKRSGEFRFEARVLDEKKTPYQLDAVWSTGKKSWLYMSEIGGDAEERPIPNGLSVIGPGSGLAADLVPGLLMPEIFKERYFAKFSSTLSADEKVGSKSCYRMECSVRGQKIWTLWIDKQSLLILKAKSGFAEEIILYSPQANPTLTMDDLKPNLKI
ncbi:MAG: hypothetical protein K8R88_07220 [Armatimonadetes bacterium]|nr:hypothetical protein [Armatimonadota bacterium]